MPKKVIYRPYYRHPKTGKIIYASQYGLRAFRIVIDEEDNKGGSSHGNK